MAAFRLKYTDAFSIIGSDQSGLEKCMQVFEWIFNSKFIIISYYASRAIRRYCSVTRRWKPEP